MKILVSENSKNFEEEIHDFVTELSLVLPNEEIIAKPYQTAELFKKDLADTEILVTSFLKINEEILAGALKLKAIVIRAAGFNTIDVEAASKRNILVCPINEYCTDEVADHTLALILALNRQLRHYQEQIESQSVWRYEYPGRVRPLSSTILAIYGFGRIGKAVAIRAKAFKLKVVVVDPFISQACAKEYGAERVDDSFVQAKAAIISNHMNATAKNQAYFDLAFFKRLKKQPLFINAGRGAAVDEAALITALDQKMILGAGLDVLASEKPDLQNHPLLHRENVLLTPHAAFYSERSIKKLIKLPCQTVSAICRNELSAVFAVNRSILHLD